MKYFTPRARTQALSFLRPRRLALACAGLCVFTAQAQVNMADSALLAQNLRAPALSETVVTATRTAQPLSDLVADVSIVDRDSIERSGATGLPLFAWCRITFYRRVHRWCAHGLAIHRRRRVGIHSARTD